MLAINSASKHYYCTAVSMFNSCLLFLQMGEYKQKEQDLYLRYIRLTMLANLLAADD